MSNISPLWQSHSGPYVQTVVDIGTHKTTCLMAKITPRNKEMTTGQNLADQAEIRQAPINQIPANSITIGRTPADRVLAGSGFESASGHIIEILGAAHQSTRGIKAGVVVDLDGVEDTLKSVIGRVEKISRLEVADLILSVSCGRLRSDNFRATTPLEGKSVTAHDIQRLDAAGRSFAERDGRVLVHNNHIGFRIDDGTGISDPTGMAGEKLAKEVHMVTADLAPLKNLLLVAERSYYDVIGLIPSAYSSAEAVLSDEEKQLGVISIDLGGGTSSYAIYGDGHFIHMDGIALGGDHITYDIARALSCPLYEAERIKTLYGTVINATSDECEMVSYPGALGDKAPSQNITKAALGRIIRPRVEEILHLIRDRIDASKLAGYAGDRIVLTGGASQLQGIAEFAAHFFGKSVRYGLPVNLGNMPSDMSGQAFSNAIGQILLSSRGEQEFGRGLHRGEQGFSGGYFENVGNWLRESF